MCVLWYGVPPTTASNSLYVYLMYIYIYMIYDYVCNIWVYMPNILCTFCHPYLVDGNTVSRWVSTTPSDLCLRRLDRTDSKVDGIGGRWRNMKLGVAATLQVKSASAHEKGWIETMQLCIVALKFEYVRTHQMSIHTVHRYHSRYHIDIHSYW